MTDGALETASIADSAVAPGTAEIRRVKKLRGALAFPGDAHQAMLACGVAALCEEPARLANLPDAPWFLEYRAALEAIGAVFEPVPEPVEGPPQWLVHGGALHAPEGPVFVGHELAALILAGICSGRGFAADLRPDPIRVPGDLAPLLAALFPASGETSGDVIRVGEVSPKARGLCKPFERKWDEGAAKIALLFRHLAAGESLELHLQRQGPDLLENLLRHFEIDLKVERDDDKEADELTRRMARQLKAAGRETPVTRVKLPAAAKPRPVFLALAGDVTEASVAALAATFARGSDLLLENVLLNAGRSALFTALRRMGADIEVVQRREPRSGGGEAQGTLRVRHGELYARRFDAEAIPDLRDEVFLLIAASACAEGESVFRDLAWRRLGPADLLKECTAALKRAGVETGEIEDGIVVRGRAESDGASYDAFGHPGLAAAWAVLALKSHGVSTVVGTDVLEARHPGLLARIASLGGGAPAEEPSP